MSTPTTQRATSSTTERADPRRRTGRSPRDGASGPAPRATPAPLSPAPPARDGAIVQLIGSFQGGGAQRLALNLAEALAGRGSRVLAVALRHAGAFTQLDTPQGVEVCALNASRERGASVLRAAWALRRLLRSCGASLVHVHGSGCVVVAALAMLGWRTRPRLVFTWHDSGSVVGGRGPRRVLTRWALRRCDALYGSSGDVAKRLGSEVGGVPPRVFINGAPTHPRTGAFDEARPRVLWMGRLVPVKDPEAMLRALAGLGSDMAFEAVLAGSALPHGAEFERQCRALCGTLGLQGRVSMPGWVDDTPALLARANIGVQSSRSEGLSIALLEMMMAGLAIVATDVGDTHRAIEDGVTGLLVPPGDTPALTAALARVAGDPDLRRRLGEAARQRALAEFSLDAMAARAAAAYRDAGASV